MSECEKGIGTADWAWLHPTDGLDPKEGDLDFHQTFFTADFDDAAWQTR